MNSNVLDECDGLWLCGFTSLIMILKRAILTDFSGSAQVCCELKVLDSVSSLA
jgi:hypothetical protein